MSNTFVVSRSHLIFGLCLPLAVLLGYLLAEPLDQGSLAIVTLVIAVLSVPILMKWYHPLLVFSWNLAINPIFLPGRPYLWMLVSFTGVFFASLNRSVSVKNKFLAVPSVTKSLLFISAVVVVTAMVTGGFGSKAFGSEQYGAKGYFYLLAAVAGYFALTSQPIPRGRVGLYVSVFFLAGLTAALCNIIYLGGPKLYFFYELFPPELVSAQAMEDQVLNTGMVRVSGVTLAAQGLFWFLLARYGVRGLLDLNKPWRLLFGVAAFAASALGGFRSALALMALTVLVLFAVQKLWRTRYMAIAVTACLMTGAVLALFVDRMPLSIQRAVSFLPLDVDPITRQNAEASNEWRIEMWKSLLPEVPQYLIKGKGYSLNPHDLYMLDQSTMRGYVSSFEISAESGEYHNGPLSVIIPFGLFGLAGLVWFMWAGVRVLHRYFKRGDEEFRTVNALLLSLFVARILFFFCVFGAVYQDLFQFTGLLGLAVAINGTEPLKDGPELAVKTA